LPIFLHQLHFPLSAVAPPLSVCGDAAVAAARASSLSAGSRRALGAPFEFLLGGDRSSGRGRRSPSWSAGGAGAWRRSGASAHGRSHGRHFWQQRRQRFRALASGHKSIFDGWQFTEGTTSARIPPSAATAAADSQSHFSESLPSDAMRCYSLFA